MSTASTGLGFLVKQAGVHTLLQDLGRFGRYSLGLTNGGPLDKTAFYWANRLVDNTANSCALEVSIGGLSLIAQMDMVIAITGAPMPVTINGVEQALWRSIQLCAGDEIRLGYSKAGLRSYLAVKGGFQTAKVFASRATVCREGVGGISGGPVKNNDVLPCLSSVTEHHVSLVSQYRPTYSNEVTLRTIPGYQQKHFSAFSQRMFYSSEFCVSQHSDRMGYRLEGKAINADIDGIISEGICHGAVQIPSDGQLIVLLNDRQTIGGYPKIGSVISLDTGKLAQLSPGAKVHFEPISMEAAHNLIHLHAAKLKATQLAFIS